MNAPQPPQAPRPWRRAGKPIVWSLFGAGGLLAALAGPALMLCTLLLIPLGLLLPPDTLSYARVLAFAQWWPGKLALLAVTSLFLFHAMFRVYHTLHDVGVHPGLGLKLLCYGFASAATAVCAALLLAL